MHLQKKLLTITFILFIIIPVFSQENTPPETWINDWRIIANNTTPFDEAGTEHPMGWNENGIDPGNINRPYFSADSINSGILALHPYSQNNPAKIRYQKKIDPEFPVLCIETSGSIHGDYLLQCLIENELISEYVVTGENWHQYKIDLSDFSKKGKELELRNTAGGYYLWDFEFCYINNIHFEKKAEE